jgi:hypothetical protein
MSAYTKYMIKILKSKIILFSFILIIIYFYISFEREFNALSEENIVF